MTIPVDNKTTGTLVCEHTLFLCYRLLLNMAEIAAGALVAEQVVSTTLEGGVVAGYAIAKPTVPLKATFSQIATADKDDTTYRYASLILANFTADTSSV
jgi:hypothetical protein